jgi:hypothetical protein
MAKKKYLIEVGQRYGLLTVSALVGTIGHNTIWECTCVCGRIVRSQPGHLVNGNVKTCGNVGCRTPGRLDHGQAKQIGRTKEYNCWKKMHQRCRNPKDPDFKNYGGRGIKVCWHWSEFANFFADMGPCPPTFTIERKDVHGNYEPSNCEWASRQTQNNNKRSNAMFEFEGRQMTVAQIARETGHNYFRLWNRLHNRKESVTVALKKLAHFL